MLTWNSILPHVLAMPRNSFLCQLVKKWDERSKVQRKNKIEGQECLILK
jgi:hypothetical protein